jgi:alpha-ketoglutarate-dependent taurine dioxygenase
MIFFSKYESNQTNLSQVFREHKVVHVNRNELIDTDSYFRDLAKKCGIPLIYEEDPITGLIDVNKWTEIKYEPEKSSDAYKSSNKSQPLHTDYGYFSFEIYAAFFYCVTQAEFGGATTFIDVDTIVNILKSTNSNLFDRIQEQKIHFGRKDNPIAHNDDFILQEDDLGWKINWNYYRAIDDTKNQTLIEDFKDFLDNYIERSGELKELKLLPGEGVFFQDRRVLHGRNSFVGNRQLNKGGIAKEVPAYVAKLISEN